MSTARRRRLLVTAALAAVALTAAAQDEPRDRADPAEKRELLERLAARGDSYGATSDARRLSSPNAIQRPRPRWVPLIPDPETARAETLAGRRARRAYDGAPPVIPHSRNFVATKTCLDCHADGIWLGKRFGPPLSHPRLVNCVQCHVESQNLEVPPSGPPVPNDFQGAAAPAGSVRPWPAAPPVIPHATHLRTDCLSCHGPASYPGLRTDHPQRANCVQCHAPAASLDQTSPYFNGRVTMVEPAPTPGAADSD